MTVSTAQPIRQEKPGLTMSVVILLLAVVALVWSYWPTLRDLAAFWQVNDDYSVGQLVPFVAAYLVWRKREQLKEQSWRPCWWALAVLIPAQFVRLLGVELASASAERLSFWVTLCTIVLLIGGWGVWRRLLWVQCFVLLMLPLPVSVHNQIAMPLQASATSMGQAGLEMLGYFIIREGNVLNINGEVTVGVDEACSGLRMLTAFVFTAATLAFLVNRPIWQKAVVTLSAVPIAVFSNGIRVIVTSVFFYNVHDESWKQMFHDSAGIMMMPVAIIVIVIELKFLAALIQDKPKKVVKPVPKKREVHAEVHVDD